MENEPAPADDLQFDRAEFDATETAAGSLECGQCKKSIFDTYYEVNGTAVCQECHHKSEEFRAGGTAIQRFALATLFGAVAAAVGAGIYYGISALTGYEFGLIAILVGFMVGFAVQAGSRGRGGWAYQLLAVGLTYCAIVATYVPQVATELRNLPVEQMAGEATPASDLQEGEEAALPPPDAEMDFDLREVPFLFWTVVVVLAFVAPFLAGFQNILGLLIIGFGLWQAWQMNRKQPHEVAGPFEIGAAPGHA